MSVQCPQCGLNWSQSTGGPCPNCEATLPASQKATGPQSLLESYLQTIQQVITKPVTFFGSMPLTGGLSGPLTFALVTHWIGQALHALWNQSFQVNARGLWDRIQQSMMSLDSETASIFKHGRHWAENTSNQFSTWFLDVGAVVADPFLTLFWILGFASILYLAARILVTPGKDQAPTQITYETSVRIVSYAYAISIFLAVPWVGNMVWTLGHYVLMAVGAKAVYRTSTQRAVVLVLSPILLGIGMMVAFFGAILLLFASAFKHFL